MRHRARKGFSLIEMVALLFSISAILSLSAVILQQAFEVHRSGLVHLQKYQALQMLEQRFRSDCHAAQACQVIEDAEKHPSLELTLPDQRTVRYSVAPGLARRQVVMGDVESASEQWQLPRNSSGTWLIESHPQCELVHFIIRFEGNESTSELEMEEIRWQARSNPFPSGRSTRGSAL